MTALPVPEEVAAVEAPMQPGAVVGEQQTERAVAGEQRHQRAEAAPTTPCPVAAGAGRNPWPPHRRR